MTNSTPVLVFDGDCGFCTSSARLGERLLRRPAAVEPWQALDLAALGLTEDEVTEAAWFVDADGDRFRGHAAVGRAMEHMHPVLRPIGWLVRHPPLAWIGAPLYSLVARNRYRLPGSTDACRLDA